MLLLPLFFPAVWLIHSESVLVHQLPCLALEMFALGALIITKKEKECIGITFSASESPLQEETIFLHLTVGKMLNLRADLLQKGALSHFSPFSIPCPWLLHTRQPLPWAIGNFLSFLGPCEARMPEVDWYRRE